MASITTAPAQVEPSSDELAASILEALAQVRAAAIVELCEEMVGTGGDLEIDSREAEAVLAMLETKYGRTLANIDDLEPECLPSVSSLADLIHRRWPNGRPVNAVGASRGRR